MNLRPAFSFLLFVGIVPLVAVSAPTSELDADLEKSTQKAIRSLASSENRIVPAAHVITVNGRKVEIATGGGDECTVVFEAGLGAGLPAWMPFVAKLNPSIGWFCYSRAGYRASTPMEGERTFPAIAKELHEILVAAEAKPPYILVGHSLGGLYMRVFASLYPGEVAGLVLDDPGYERFNFDLHQIAPDLFDKLTFVPPSSPAILKAELAGADRIYAKGTLDMDEPDLPLVILTGTLPPKDTPENLRSIFSRLGNAKLEAHAKLANSRSQSRHFLCGRTGHSVHSDVPEMLIEAIDWVRKHATTQRQDP